MTTQPIEDIAHGTYRGYQQHKRYNIPICDPCRDANAAYHNKYRSHNPEKHAQHQRVQQARGRALRRLAKLHPLDMLDLYQEELRKLRTQESQ